MRKNISILLTVTFIIISVTGISLLGHGGEIRHNLIRHVHELVGILFIIVGLIHLKFNFKSILSYIGIKRKQL